jgi:hypothetical protein
MNRPLRRWPLFERMLVAQGAFLAMVWAGYLALFVAVTVAIAVFGSVRTSVWEQASQLPRWFTLFIGVYLTGTYLRLAVAHGRTRREFMAQASAFLVAYSALFAVLMTLGFVVETAIYRLGGWPQTLNRDHLFTSPGQLGRIFVAFWLVFAVWTVVGAMIAAAFHRNGLLGVLGIAAGLLLIVPTELAVGFNPVPVVSALVELATVPVAAIVAMCAGSFALALALTWAIVRDTPIRPRSA